MPSTSGSGPASTQTRSSSCRARFSFPGRPGRRRLRSPAEPSALPGEPLGSTKRTTASRNDWRSARQGGPPPPGSLPPTLAQSPAPATLRNGLPRPAQTSAARLCPHHPGSLSHARPSAFLPRTRPRGVTLQPRRITSESTIVATGIIPQQQSPLVGQKGTRGLARWWAPCIKARRSASSSSSRADARATGARKSWNNSGPR